MCPRGPCSTGRSRSRSNSTLDVIEAHARRKGCIFVKIHPDVREDTTVGRLALHAMQRRGWRFTADQIQFKNTAYSDLSVGEEALLATMKGKWRYNFRLAERGLSVRMGGEADLESFYTLYVETARVMVS